jgi:hypothetical protein
MGSVSTVAIRLSAQRALLDAVIPQLRAVIVSAENGQWRVRFYSEGDLSDSDLETLQIAATEILSDSPYGANWEERFERLDPPTPIPAIPGFEFVFARREA